jgi:hypothetical protein
MMDISSLHAFFARPEIHIPLIGLTLGLLLVLKRPATALYVGLIPLINWSFAAVPTLPIDGSLGGGVFQPLAVVTGLVLVVRDFAQREIGHWIFGAMALGLTFSSMTTPLNIVLASGAAFLISEVVDWAVFTFTKRPLSQRILMSSALAAPLDSAVFLYGASFSVPGIFAWGTMVSSIVSKLAGALVVSWLVAKREQRMKPA